MNIDTYERSYVEVLEILKHIPKTEYEKIPKEQIDFFNNNCDKTYNFVYDENNLNLSRKTYAIIVNLYKNYIANESKKKIVEDALLYNSRQAEMAKREKYNADNLFKNNNTLHNNPNSECTSLDVIKIKWYEKVFRFFKNIFMKKDI